MKGSGFFSRLSDRARRLAQSTFGEAKPENFDVFSGDDAEMNLAKDRAKATMHHFWASYDAKDDLDEGHLVKAGLTTPNGALEHVWLHVTSRMENQFVGVLAVEPMDLTDVSIGDEIVVDMDRLSDWTFLRDSQVHGNFTTRVMFLRGGPEQRKLAESFAPLPTECDLH